jgi:hypothetical protein
MHEPVLLQQPSGHVFGPQDEAPSPAMVRSPAASLDVEVSPLEPSRAHVSVSVQTLAPQPSMSTVAAMAVMIAATASM